MEYNDFINAPPAGWFGSEAGKFSKSHENQGRLHWIELHTKQAPSPDWLADWESRIPKYCNCFESYLTIKKANQPRLEDWHAWTWETHNAVNSKLRDKGLDRPNFTWEQYREKWLRWKPVDGNRIGIVSVNYESLGGTETFHQTLVPKLPGVIGFVSLNDLQGDAAKLGVPTGQGIDAINSLAQQCDTVVSWNIDWETTPRPRRVIAVHHGSIEDEWGTRFALMGDEIVCVNRDVAAMVRTRTTKPVHCIEPAVNPERVEPRNQVETNGKKIVLWAHRFHVDKRPQLAIEIAKRLPEDWHMVLTGYRGEPLEPNDRVTILPPMHPGDWLSVASCFLSTTLWEGFGLSVAEAVAAGVPVVSTPTGVAARPGVAITVPIEASPEEWAAAIVSSGSHPLPPRDLFSLDAFLSAWIDCTKNAPN